MSSLLTLVVLGHAMVNVLTHSSEVSSAQGELPDQLLQLQAQRYNYTYTPGIGAHKVHTQVTTWNEARRICEAEGGHLAIINSVTESRVVGQLLNNSGDHFGSQNKGSAFIGVHDLYGDNDWVTIHGESLATAGFDIWLPGEPSHDGNNAHCVSLCKDKLNDVMCNAKIASVCELSLPLNSHLKHQEELIDPRIQPQV